MKAQDVVLNLKVIGSFQDVTSGITQVQQMLGKVKLPDNLKNSFNGIFSNLTTETKKYQDLLNSGFKKKGDVTGLESSAGKINTMLQKLRVEMDKIKDSDLRNSFQVDPAKLDQLTQKAAQLQKNLQSIMSSSDMVGFKNQAAEAAKEIEKISKTKFTANFTEAFNKGDINGATEALKRLVENHKAFQDGGKEKTFQDSIIQMRAALDGLSQNDGLLKVNQQIKETNNDIRQLDATEFQNLINAFSQGKTEVGEFAQGTKKLTDAQQSAARAAQEHQQQLDQFKNRVMYFFSLTNSVQLFKRAVKSALNTVKELDKTMTEAAVVTDFSIGDMWNKLPQYSDQARKLGVSINGLYEATTLYYQQGLKTNEAMQLGVETMKMAKIAGMDSAEATKAMTAALRGFNMELNEVSAARVNDVYSQLAAITAADANQISTAMEKTASIAANANMEFETTAALLAQIIETTQEAPETAGTAMKTIVARFSEVKKLREEGQYVGQDTEGEEIDVNRIQQALRTAGISMTGFFEGTEGLDSILLKLAEKWNVLDFETQRYIATMAAGSRQQSRFIAMMSDYKRTTELVEEASNSSGESQKKFNKTLESMESKTQRLKNAWNEFTMSIANNEVLKTGVDFLTKLIEGINGATNALTGGKGLVKGVLSLSMAFAGIKAAKGLLAGVFTKLGVPTAGNAGAVDANARAKTAYSMTGSRKMGMRDFFTKPSAKENSILQAQQKTQADNMEINNRARHASINSYRQQISGISAKNGADLKAIKIEAEKTYGSVLKQTGDVTKATEAANLKVRQMGGSFEQAATGVGRFKQAVGAINWQSVGQGAMVAGGAILALGSIMSQMGLEEAGEKVTKFGGIIMALGSIVMVLPPLFKILGKAINSSFGWIGLVIAGLVAVIAIIAKFVKKGKSLSEQIEDINDQIDNMKDAAKGAAESLQKITDTKSELQSMQDTFKGLVKGTNEWRQALVDSNAKVLELIETYPELAQYINRDENGLLTVTSEGWAEIIEKQQNAIVSTQTTAAALLIEKNYLKTKKLTQEISRQVLSGEGETKESRAKMDALALETETSIGAYYTDVIAMDQQLSSSSYSQSAANILSTSSAEEMVYTMAEEFLSDFWDMSESDLKEKYAELTGKTEKEINQLMEDGLSTSDMRAAIAANEAAKKDVEKMKKLTNQIAASKDRDLLQRMFSKQGEGLRNVDIKEINKTLSAYGGTKDQQLKQYLSEQNIQLDDEQLKAILDALTNVETAFGDEGEISKALSKWGLNTEKIEQLVLSGEYGTGYQLSKKFGELVASGASVSEIENLASQIQAITQGLSQEDRDQALSWLADFNWQSEEQIADTMQLLAGLEFIDESKLEGLEKAIDELAKATSENTNAQLQTKMWVVEDYLKQILSGDIDENNLTTEQKEALEKTGFYDPTKFEQIGTDQWMYTGDLYSDTVKVYGKTVQDKLENALTASEKVERAILFQGAIDDFNNNDSSGRTSWEAYANTEDYDVFVANNSIEDLVEAYKYLAKAQDIIPNENLTPEEMFNQIIEWNKTFGYENFEVLKQEAEEEAIQQARTVVANTELTTAQIGYASFNNEEATNKYAAEYEKAIDNRLKATGGSVFLKDLEAGLSDVDKASGKFETTIKALASDVASVATKTKTLAENMSELAEDLALPTNTPEYGKALARAKSNVANYFGVDEDALKDVSEEFYKDLADGDPAALQEMQNKILDTLLVAYGIAEENFAGMVGAFTIDPNMDETEWAAFQKQFGTNITTMADDAAKELEKVLSLANIQITYTTDKNGNIIGASTTALDRSGWYSSYTKKSDSSNKYENSYDKLHNTLEEINDLLRERERLERRYQRLIDRNSASAAQLADLSKQIVATHQLEIDKQEEVLAGRMAQIEQELASHKSLQKYVQVEKDQYGDQTLRIDWEALEKLKNADTGEKVDEYYDNIDTWLESIYEAEVAIEEAQDAIYEEMTKGMDEYLDLEEQVKEAIITMRQKEIDELSNINESINDANSKLLDSMQEQIDAYRQARENEKTEEELSDKQRRLSYLQQDTSGANALEIMQLQKEIEEGQESYTDQLIDQKISELQKQNDQAAEQRQHQIDLAQAQLDQYSKSKEIWEKVENLIANGINQDGKLVGPLEALMKEANGYDSLSKIGQMKWLNDIETLIASALSWRGDGQKVMASLFGGSTVSFTTSDGKVVSGEVLEDGRVKDAETGNVYEKVVWGGEDKFSTTEGYQEKKVEPTNKPDNYKETQSNSPPKTSGYYQTVKAWKFPKTVKLQGGQGFSSKSAAEKELSNQYEQAKEELRNYFADKLNTPEQLPGNWLVGQLKSLENQYNSAKNKIEEYSYREWVAYKTGGLADFTGPAWLDGTKSRPEYILNADQTKAFFTLVDVLSGLGLGNSNSTEKTGDISYDIDINVESIGSDYDVEQIAETIKRLINEDARYRNNNTVNLMR